MAGSPSLEALEQTANRLRIDILEMITVAGSGHPGGSLSAIDLITSIYGSVLKHDPKNPEDADRDRFILSKGHGVPALYAVMAEYGYFDRALLPTLRKLGSPLQGHPVRGMLPGIEACTGSLGQGLSIAVGAAIGAKMDKKGFRAFCLMGDGEIQEGQVWEAAMSAGKLKLDNVIGILDFNKAQIDGLVEDVMPIEPVEAKWQSFGWKTRRINGHDFQQIADALVWATTPEGAPKMIVADTIKGKGVSFMESALLAWHGAAPTRAQCDQAVGEIQAKLAGAKS